MKENTCMHILRNSRRREWVKGRCYWEKDEGRWGLREGDRQQVSDGELKDHPGPSNHAPLGSTSSSNVNERSHLPALFVPFAISLFSVSVSLSRTDTRAATPHAPTAISGPLHEINWPPTKDSTSQITSGEKWAIAIIVTECVEDLFKYVIPKHGLGLCAPRIVGYLLTIMN